MKQALETEAKRNHRSPNDEILAKLPASNFAEPVDVEALLERVRARRETLGKIDLSEDTLRVIRDAGRP